MYLAQYSILQGGNPNRVIRGVDMQGRICGVDEEVKDKGLAAWPYPPVRRMFHFASEWRD